VSSLGMDTSREEGKARVVKIVSGDGFTLLSCRRFCCRQSLKEPGEFSFQREARNRFNINLLKPQNSTGFNNCWNLVRDQGVGGSNPLSPTNPNRPLISRAYKRTHPALLNRSLQIAGVIACFRHQLQLYFLDHEAKHNS